MKKELPHFYIGASYGGNQEWFSSFMMRRGGFILAELPQQTT